MIENAKNHSFFLKKTHIFHLVAHAEVVHRPPHLLHHSHEVPAKEDPAAGGVDRRWTMPSGKPVSA